MGDKRGGNFIQRDERGARLIGKFSLFTYVQRHLIKGEVTLYRVGDKRGGNFIQRG